MKKGPTAPMSIPRGIIHQFSIFPRFTHQIPPIIPPMIAPIIAIAN